MKRSLLLTCIVAALLISCGGDKEEKKSEPEVKKDTSAKKTEPSETPAAPKRPPVINITDTVSAKQLVIYIKDSAASTARLEAKLADILGVKLDAVIKKNKLKRTGPPIAWYKNTKLPYFFEAGLPVDKKPAKLPPNVLTREIGVDSVTVAHFYGAYELLPQAYEALGDWMKEHKKKLDGKPYEIYVDDPMDKDGKMKDPYKVRTDVIFPWK